MNRRRLLAVGTTGVLVGTGGCLATEFGTASDNESADGCSQFDGEFGALSISVPAEPPDDAPAFEMGDTTLPTLEKVGQELESAKEQYRDAEKTIDEYGIALQRVGWVTLGNGQLYDSVETALTEFEAVDTKYLPDKRSPIVRWYTVYDDDIFRLELRRRDYPFGKPNTDASTHITDDPLEVTVASRVPTSADVIHADEELIPESEFFATVLDVAKCERSGADFEFIFSSTMNYYIPHEETDVLTHFEKAESGWYVEYEDEFYVFDIHFSEY